MILNLPRKALAQKSHVTNMYVFNHLTILIFGIYMVYQWSMVYHGKPMVYQSKKMKNHCKSNLLLRVLCACEPSVLSIPNVISRTVSDTTVVRILHPSNFSLWFPIGRAYSSPIRVCASSFRYIFWIISTSIRNNPSTFFQNTYTILVRFFFFSVIPN